MPELNRTSSPNETKAPVTPILTLLRDFALAAFAVWVAWVARMALDRYWGDSMPYVTFYAAMVIVIWFADTGPAIAALIASLLLGDFFFTAPRHTIGFASTGEWLSAGFFALGCLVLLFFVRKLRRNQQALQASQTRLEPALAELNQAHARTKLLAETASQLLLSSEPQYVVDALCAKVMAFLDCDAFLNFLVDEQRPDWLRLNAYAGIPEEEAKTLLSLEMKTTLSGSAVREGCPVVVEDILHKSDPRTAAIKKLGIQAYACHPMKVQDRVVGTLSFGTRSRLRFHESEMALMKAVADLVAIALERQRSQTELQRMNLELEQRVMERTQSLQEMTEQLNTFCYSVAHDLRSPLRTQMGFARVLMDDFGERLGEEGKRYAALVLQAAERQSNVIQDLMAHISVSRGDMPLEPISLGDAIARARADLTVETQQKEAVIDDSQANSGKVIANGSSLHLVILNLLTNACKFVAPGKRPQVRLWTQVRKEPVLPSVHSTSNEPGYRFVRLWVEDNGIGIDPKDQAKLFRMFQRLNKPTLYPGTGMGLAIVKKAVERMGGRVGAESEPGKGSRFWVELRAAN